MADVKTNLPEEDLVPVVRCEDCIKRLHNAAGTVTFCPEIFRITPDDFYCGFGKRKEG